MSNTNFIDSTRSLQRSHAYGFLAAAMEYPEGELTGLIRAGDIARQARELFGSLYPELENTIDWKALAEAGEADELSIEYTRLFDVGGADGPPCTLNSGAAKGDSRMGLLEELVRFYNYFGLTAAETEANELPDHLTTQFEFLHYLSQVAAGCVEGGEAADDYVRAQRDFLNRHPGSWVPLLNGKLKQQKAPAYYQTVGELMERFIRIEQRELELAVSHLPAPEPHAVPADASSVDAALDANTNTAVITIHRKAH